MIAMFSYVPEEQRPMSYVAAMGILRLANKYMVKFLRNRMIARFHRAIPTKFEEITVKRKDGLTQTFSEGASFFDYRLVELFRECRVLALLPMIMYIFATKSGKSSKRLLSSRSISQQDLHVLIAAREAILLKVPKLFTSALLEVADGCSKGEVCSPQHRLLLLDSYLSLPLAKQEAILDLELETIPCPACDTLRKSKFRQGRKKLWDELPILFGLPPWTDLLKEFDTV